MVGGECGWLFYFETTYPALTNSAGWIFRLADTCSACIPQPSRCWFFKVTWRSSPYSPAGGMVGGTVMRYPMDSGIHFR